ncbi:MULTISPECIES: methyl-accepting chemotaxis protein [Bacillaceae]|uniref:methyl-accepting chemotaxis protein n=1 Tax=Niallia TaxID=2837506 RepID=UPI001E5FF32B|nr:MULTISPECIES: methyl-accepting chemotaxis protein [Bacillaceae]MCE4048216.1 methyl-accepting chemotaxis protein [Bacillus sp. Au-Bac7]MCM3033955.1 methyl-accepting chemotaxis protein [Niallia sp. MER 6]MDL0434264.1 methyl-accepting chemotaxis protein [Niallia sp. SS-2023]UPO89017.1 methyl-accepting chemotaxis protein [Niallia sp. Man26]
MKLQLKMKLGTKINLIVVAIIIVLSVVVGYVANSEITRGIKEFATEKAKGDLALSYNYVNSEYPGEWKADGDKLLKGETIINDNNELVDIIGKDTHDTVTFFLGDTRIATNVMTDGKRATGTQASQEVIDTVINNGETYYGEANVVGKNYQTAYMPLKNAAGEVVGIMYVGASEEMIDNILSSFLTKFVIVLIIMVVIAVAVVLLFTNSIRKRLKKLTAALELAGNGDFTSKVEDKSTDELSLLSVSYNKMTDSLKSMMNEVISTSEQLASSSEQLTASSEETSKATEVITESIQQVANGADQSASNVQDSAAALVEVTEGIQSIADNAQAVSDVGLKATEKAKNGGLYVDKTVQKITEINHSVAKTGEAIKNLDSRSQEIEKITNVITDIANQTNLLALNAAIEAARAGENGKGFAVVADEVRKLAEQSQASSAQISALIKTIQADMVQSNASMEQVTLDVKEGLEIVEQTKANFTEIMDFMQNLTEQIEGMAHTSEILAAGTQEVATTVSEIQNISGQTSMHSQNVAASAEEQLASMEEIAASAQALSHLAEDLKEVISKFKV